MRSTRRLPGSGKCKSPGKAEWRSKLRNEATGNSLQWPDAGGAEAACADASPAAALCAPGNKLALRTYTTIGVFFIPFRLSTPKGASMDSPTPSTSSTPSTPETSSTLFRNRDRGSVIGGLVLIVLGVLFLLDNYFDIRFGDLWPLILVAGGVGLLWRSRNTGKQ